MDTIPLRARHFRHSNRMSMSNCALAQAIKEYYDTDDVKDYVHYAIINGRTYYHEEYNQTTEWWDNIAARCLLFSGIKLKSITLYENIFQMPGYYKSIIKMT